MEHFDLECVTSIEPHNNKQLEGFYKSDENVYCSQCEPEGFRRVTFFADRPDIQSLYSTRIEADKSRFPVLLSNGNLVDSGNVDGERHFAIWQDPWRKPSYLFAIVACKLPFLEDFYFTKSGKKVTLRIFTEPENVDKVVHAMESLKRAMQFDEEVYGLEYDLQIMQIVAVNSFSMGAMENKSLNIFNSRYVIASPQIATDRIFRYVERIVGHESVHLIQFLTGLIYSYFLIWKVFSQLYRKQSYSKGLVPTLSERGTHCIQRAALLRDCQLSYRY